MPKKNIPVSSVPPEDEFVHQGYPRNSENSWKENWYFNFIDRKNNAWGINHISLERHKQRARFSAFHVVDEEQLIYLNYIPLGEDFRELTDGKLRFEFLKPHQEFRVTFEGPKHSVALSYLARFDVFDFGARNDESFLENESKISAEHYEQALTVKGTLTKAGVSRPIECFGHRDHTWGYREEENIAGWNWVTAQFPDKTINITQLRIGDMPPMTRGFVSEASGNTGIREMKIVSTEKNEKGIPLGSVFEVVDERGRAWTLATRKFSGVVVPASEKRKDVVVYENFSEFTLEQTGAKAVGIDEYLVSP